MQSRIFNIFVACFLAFAVMSMASPVNSNLDELEYGFSDESGMDYHDDDYYPEPRHTNPYYTGTKSYLQNCFKGFCRKARQVTEPWVEKARSAGRSFENKFASVYDKSAGQLATLSNQAAFKMGVLKERMDDAKNKGEAIKQRWIDEYKVLEETMTGLKEEIVTRSKNAFNDKGHQASHFSADRY